jgi:carboxylesterase type B
MVPSLAPFLDNINLNSAGADLGQAMGGGPTSEDCLFLDVVVPGKAWRGEQKIPIINWIYGGAYILGSKDGMYDGTPIVRASGNNLIYVTGNYRLGAHGFLPGNTVEADSSAVSNAGLWDQRAVLEWIQEEISKFGGDKDDVSVWVRSSFPVIQRKRSNRLQGESAGAGSIMHHLTAFGGKTDPLFKKAVIQSPAFTPVFDRRGDAEKTYQDFAQRVGCAGKGIDCLRGKDFKVINDAQFQLIDALPFGMFGFGPSVDGTWVRQLPALELATGNFAKEIESIIVTHVSDEASMFVQGEHNATTFDRYLTDTYGKKYGVFDAVEKQFPQPTAGSKYQSHKARLQSLVQFSSFTCNTRFLAEAYKSKTYSAQYSVGQGQHGTDVASNFYGSWNPAQYLPQYMMSGGADLKSIAPKYQSYLISHARTGDPNFLKARDSLEWPKVHTGPIMSNVLNVNSPFSLIADVQNKAEDCDFWLDVFSGLTNAGGERRGFQGLTGQYANIS